MLGHAGACCSWRHRTQAHRRNFAARCASLWHMRSGQVRVFPEMVLSSVVNLVPRVDVASQNLHQSQMPHSDCACRVPSESLTKEMGKVCDGTNVALIATLLKFYLPGIIQDGVDATLQKRLKAASHMICAKMDDSCSVLFALGVAVVQFETAKRTVQHTLKGYADLQTVAGFVLDALCELRPQMQLTSAQRDMLLQRCGPAGIVATIGDQGPTEANRNALLENHGTTSHCMPVDCGMHGLVLLSKVQVNLGRGNGKGEETECNAMETALRELAAAHGWDAALLCYARLSDLRAGKARQRKCVCSPALQCAATRFAVM